MRGGTWIWPARDTHITASLSLKVVSLFLLPPAIYRLTYDEAIRIASAQTTAAFRNLESPQVGPPALTPDGKRLLARPRVSASPQPARPLAIRPAGRLN